MHIAECKVSTNAKDYEFSMLNLMGIIKKSRFQPSHFPFRKGLKRITGKEVQMQRASVSIRPSKITSNVIYTKLYLSAKENKEGRIAPLKIMSTKRHVQKNWLSPPLLFSSLRWINVKNKEKMGSSIINRSPSILYAGSFIYPLMKVVKLVKY